jgi:chromate transporter
VGAPYVERLRQARRPAGALRFVSAAVTGVVAHLSVWFTLHLLFARHGEQSLGPLALEAPELGSLSWPALGLVAVACVGAFALRLGVFGVLGLTLAAAVGLALAGWA